MDKNNIVPMITEPTQFPNETYFSMHPRHIEEQKMPEYVQKILIDAMRQERAKNNFNGFGFDYEVRPDRFVKNLRSKDPYNFYGKESGMFSVSELNDLLRRDYDMARYNLEQSKQQAEATQNIMNQIINATKGIY